MRQCSQGVCFDILGNKRVPIRLKPKIGVLPSVNGLSWFGVVTISNWPLFTTNQAQPEPKRAAALSANSF